MSFISSYPIFHSHSVLALAEQLVEVTNFPDFQTLSKSPDLLAEFDFLKFFSKTQAKSPFKTATW